MEGYVDFYFFFYCSMYIFVAVVIAMVLMIRLSSVFFDGREGGFSLVMVVVILFGLAGFSLAFKDKEEFYQTEEKTEVVEIFAAGISNGSEGNIYVLRDRDFYRYYVGDSISGFELRKIPADISTVKYTNGKPYIKAMYDQYIKYPDMYDNMRYELYIPHGSVVSDYTIKL
ncbi:MAG: hypothetical protein ACRC26_03270 [Bacteroidales bacterium]